VDVLLLIYIIISMEKHSWVIKVGDESTTTLQRRSHSP